MNYFSTQIPLGEESVPGSDLASVTLTDTQQPAGGQAFLRKLNRLPLCRRGEILVVPLGGVGRIGMNWTLYGSNNRWILVDAGIGFPEDRKGPQDAFIPDPALLAAMGRQLECMIVTHAHEDHIGAIHSVWPKTLQCPIFATPFAAAVIRKRLSESKTLGLVQINEFLVGSSFKAGPFSVDTIRMTHSVPEPVALALTTQAGTILHTGDWKMDPNPLIGLPADTEKLQALGNSGILAMVCDSTNADRETEPTSEADVRKAFISLCESRPGAVVFVCFSSNIARIASASIAAFESGRYRGIAGRSMRNNEEIASKLGLLEDVPKFFDNTMDLLDIEKREMAIVCTGAQGEEAAALARMTRVDQRLPKLGQGDTVVMSARVIPGNEEAIAAVITDLKALGVEVIDSKQLIDGLPVHSSGHAGRSELRRMHQLVRPRFVLPVHGEQDNMQSHALLARETGAEATHVSCEGEVLSVSPYGIRSLGRLEIAVVPLLKDAKGNRAPYVLIPPPTSKPSASPTPHKKPVDSARKTGAWWKKKRLAGKMAMA